MKKVTRGLLIGTMTVLLAATAVPVSGVMPAQASEIRVVVNETPITSYDIQRRQAFLRLQQQGGGADRATTEMIDQTLRLQEMQRLNVRISEDQVTDSYNNFARTNNLTAAQLNEILADSGVTRDHFRQFIRAQMGWAQVLQARAQFEQGGGGRVSEQEAVRRMMEQGGEKPSATEYMLQQVIFVVPAAERGARLAQRRREAEQLRARFQSCETTREMSRGLIDVTVRDLGRVLQPELPPDWKDRITSIRAGQATTVRDTERGVEFIAICSAREVSDDHVAQLVFQAENQTESGLQALSEKYQAELRERARINRR
ncbi:peptidylprolyl isomerase [Chelativorans sp. ZYF759]|uniref:SurA N-terminal domain-containing protein n=1 Tax=Chelativorans sp. ZYF759 TaxID=2692213 RepID=UPI00145E5433|nr:SurA N-terminal domain-containing protein [Chelativorans sp. ZYF759]NMG38738.1 peptidylprolyl isomerase [Chelativorans sp. ZYF759]